MKIKFDLEKLFERFKELIFNVSCVEDAVILLNAAEMLSEQNLTSLPQDAILFGMLSVKLVDYLKEDETNA